MVLNSYSVLDTKTGVYSAPWFFGHDAMAFRAIGDLGRDASTNLGRYPDDYVLYLVGRFDDNTGGIVGVAPVNLGSVSAIVAALSSRNGDR